MMGGMTDARGVPQALSPVVGDGMSTGQPQVSSHSGNPAAEGMPDRTGDAGLGSELGQEAPDLRDGAPDSRWGRLADFPARRRRAARMGVLSGTRSRYVFVRELLAREGLDTDVHRLALLGFCAAAAVLHRTGRRILLVVGFLVALPVAFMFYVPAFALFGEEGFSIVAVSIAWMSLVLGAAVWAMHKGRSEEFAVRIVGVAGPLSVLIGLVLLRVNRGRWPAPAELPEPGTWATYVALALVGGGWVCSLAALASILAVRVVGRVQLSLWINRWPAEVVFAELLFILRMLERPPAAPAAQLPYRQNIIARLNRVALCLRYGFPKLLTSGSAGDAEIRRHYAGVATAFDGHKVWVAIPKADTQEHLRSVLALAAYSIACGHYDDLPVAAEPLKSIRSRWADAASAARTTLVAVLPAAVLFAATRFAVPLSATQRSWFAVAAAVWFVVVVVSALDPLLSTRVTTMRDVLSALRGSK